MRLKKYCVTVMDNWTPMRDFWTYDGAKKFRDENLGAAHLHQWFGGRWVEILGPPGDRSISTNPLAARCYTMSEPHLSGYRLVLGFNTVDEVGAAQQYIANLPRS
jgi:hypothetical protein